MKLNNISWSNQQQADLRKSKNGGFTILREDSILSVKYDPTKATAIGPNHEVLSVIEESYKCDEPITARFTDDSNCPTNECSPNKTALQSRDQTSSRDRFEMKMPSSTGEEPSPDTDIEDAHRTMSNSSVSSPENFDKWGDWVRREFDKVIELFN